MSKVTFRIGGCSQREAAAFGKLLMADYEKLMKLPKATLLKRFKRSPLASFDFLGKPNKMTKSRLAWHLVK